MSVLLQATLSCERDQRQLFTDLNVCLRSGDTTELVGPNGAGKSTLLRCLAGLDSQYEGQIERNAPMIYQGHRTGLNGTLTARENLHWYVRLLPLTSGEFGNEELAANSASDIDSALRWAGLRGHDDVPCQQLSEGQQRRVCLARLWLQRTPIWLLDEPLTALDVQAVSLLREVLEAHRTSGGAALVATHSSLGVGTAVLRLADP